MSKKVIQKRRTPRYRELMVRIGQELSDLPTLLPRAPHYMCKNERELSDCFLDPYYKAIATARGIILFETTIKPEELAKLERTR